MSDKIITCSSICVYFYIVAPTFDKDRLKALIEKVVVYGEDAMEIVWKVGNPHGL